MKNKILFRDFLLDLPFSNNYLQGKFQEMFLRVCYCLGLVFALSLMLSNDGCNKAELTDDQVLLDLQNTTWQAVSHEYQIIDLEDGEIISEDITDELFISSTNDSYIALDLPKRFELKDLIEHNEFQATYTRNSSYQNTIDDARFSAIKPYIHNINDNLYLEANASYSISTEYFWLPKIPLYRMNFSPVDALSPSSVKDLWGYPGLFITHIDDQSIKGFFSLSLEKGIYYNENLPKVKEIVYSTFKKVP